MTYIMMDQGIQTHKNLDLKGYIYEKCLTSNKKEIEL